MKTKEQMRHPFREVRAANPKYTDRTVEENIAYHQKQAEDLLGNGFLSGQMAASATIATGHATLAIFYQLQKNGE